MTAAMPTRYRWLLALASTLVALIAIEVGWRIYLFHFASQAHVRKWARVEDMPGKAMKFVPHPYLGYCLNPEYRSEDGLDRHNALGFRGGEFPREKPSGTYRIACLGGSSTYDVSIRAHRDSYPDQLEAALRETWHHPNVQVVNAGVPGYTSWESLINLQYRVLDIDPDLIIYYEATNDVHARLVPPAAYRRDNTGYRRAWTVESRWWDRSLFLHYLGVQLSFSQRNSLDHWVDVDIPKNLDKAACLDANPPRYFQANLETMVTLAKQRKVGVLFTSWAHSPHKGDYASTAVYQRGFRENNDVLRAVARANDVPFYDFAAEMPIDAECWDDGRHSTERGALKKAKLFAAWLHREVLSRH